MPYALVVLLELLGTLVAVGVFILLVLVASHYTTGVRVRHEAVSTNRFNGQLTIMFLSDMHYGRFSPPWALRAIRSMASRLTNVDVVLLGGDYIDLEARYVEKLDELLRTLNSRLGVPVLGVLGNHEDEAPNEIRQCFRRNEAILLENAARRLEKHGEPYLVIGLKDVTHPDISYPGEDCRNWYGQFDETDPELYRILVCHNPKGIELAGDRRPDLVLSGHTHGGSIAPIAAVLSRLGGRDERVRRRIVDGSVQIIGWGLGSYGASFGRTIPPMRFLTPFEIVVVEVWGEQTRTTTDQ